MIVELTFPPSVSSVKYGAARMIPSDDHKLDVPAYVAKTLLSLDGVTGPALADSAIILLRAADESELPYIFLAYGKPLPDEDRATAADDLMAAKGEPLVSVS